jgi:hypothetical protein
MPYVVINGDTTHYKEDIVPFTTQHGKNAINFIGDELPETDKGFKFYDDDDNLISDLSEYIHIYRQNAYSTEEDIIIPPKGSDAPLPPSSYDILNSRVSQVSSQVAAITPFEETQKAYYAEIEKVFYNIPEGNTTIFFDNYDGEYTVERIENRLTVKFPERLKDMTNITVIVNK